MSDPAKEEVKKTIVTGGKIIGSTLGAAAGAAAAGAGAANVAAAANAAYFATTGGGVFASFVTGSTTPALWAVIATNPITAPIAVVGGAIVGAVGAYKLVKKWFD